MDSFTYLFIYFSFIFYTMFCNMTAPWALDNEVTFTIMNQSQICAEQNSLWHDRKSERNIHRQAWDEQEVKGVNHSSIPVLNRRRAWSRHSVAQHEDFGGGWEGCKTVMIFSGITITRTRKGSQIPTHSSSTCFMRTDTLQASLVTSLLSGKARRTHSKTKLSC